MGEDNTGKLDLGIFIASIVPDGPADKDGRIKPGLKHRQMETKLVCMLQLMKRILQGFVHSLFIICLFRWTPHFSKQDQLGRSDIFGRCCYFTKQPRRGGAHCVTAKM